MSFQNCHKEFEKFWPERSKVSKLFTLMGSFRAKYILFEPKKFIWILFHDIEKWCKIWRKTDLLLGKWHEEFGKFSPEHSKVSKFEHWWDPFVQSRKCMSLKFTEKLCLMAMKNDTKIEEELTCRIKINMRELTRALESLKHLCFNWLLWPKYIFQLRKVQRSYVWWHWRLMQNLKEKWLVLS